MPRKKKDPRVGTGKKPKGSGRRLYTDENPKDTVRIKFATPADARATVAKVKKLWVKLKWSTYLNAVKTRLGKQGRNEFCSREKSIRHL